MQHTYALAPSTTIEGRLAAIEELIADAPLARRLEEEVAGLRAELATALAAATSERAELAAELGRVRAVLAGVAAALATLSPSASS